MTGPSVLRCSLELARKLWPSMVHSGIHQARAVIGQPERDDLIVYPIGAPPFLVPWPVKTASNP